MKQFGVFYAKTHFSELLADVVKGEKFRITRYGRTVAMLIPVEEEKDQNAVSGAIRAIKNLRSGTKLGKGLLIKQNRY